MATPGKKISFCLKISETRNLDKKADGNCTLASEIQNDLPQDVRNYIFLAKLKGHDHDEAAVSPVLLCKLLKEDSVVRTVKKENTNPSREIPKTMECQHIFFLRTAERRNKEAITVARLTLYDGKDLCVVSFNEETLEEALLKDKRLTNVERFRLNRDDHRQSEVSLDKKAGDYNNYVFNVSVEKTGKKMKSSTSSENSSGPLPMKKEVTEEDPEKLHEDDCIVVYPGFSLTLVDSFSDEIAEHMIKQAQDEARSTFISQTKQRNNNVPTLAQLVTKFAKKTPTARPARTLQPLADCAKSVGYLECGSVKGTCFWVGKNLVMTAHHILNMIMEARSNATEQNNIDAHATIYIYFDYLYAGQLSTRQALLPRVEVDETKETFGNSQLDYALLVLKENDVLGDRTPLGSLVRNTIPESGVVTIIGHPDGGELLEDACRIICSPHSNIRAFYSRAEKKAQHCVENPMSCSNNNFFAKCVHMYVDRPVGQHAHQLAYDTTLFEGSSGSPVFNTDGHIVAMHTHGYPIPDNKGKPTSIMEFGVTFTAIFEDIKSRFGQENANRLFPNCT